jgi:hypothetical protein
MLAANLLGFALLSTNLRDIVPLASRMEWLKMPCHQIVATDCL